MEQRLSEQLRAAIEGAEDLTPAMDDISERLLESTRRRFDTESGVSGVPWKKSRRAIEDGGKTLQDSGRLYRALDRRSGPTFAEVGVRAGGPPEIYAAIHQFGGTIRPRHKKALSFAGRVVAQVVMPARPYLGFDPEDREDIVEVLTAHLRRSFDEAAA
nr:phage virion morphogenesis protein [Erythrobacter sp. LQ02-29]